MGLDAQKASDAMRLMAQADQFFGGAAGGAGVDTYQAKLADLTLLQLQASIARAQSDTSLTDVLKNALADGLKRRVGAVAQDVLRPVFD